jgi:hypothetical protein
MPPNLFRFLKPTSTDLAVEDRDSGALSFMLREIGPRVLLLHGKKVAEAFQARYRQTPTDTFTSMTIEGRRMIVRGVPHLSSRRGFSRSRAIELGNATRFNWSSLL